MTESARQLQAEGVQALLATIDASRRDTIFLDLRAFRTLEREAAALLAAALLTTYGAASLEVALGEAPLDWLSASGLAFALANRRGRTEVRGKSVSVNTLAEWSRSWYPGDGAPPRAMSGDHAAQLFSAAALGESDLAPDRYGPDFAAFLNPHLASAALGTRHPLTTLLHPWLDRLLPRPRLHALGSSRRSEWVADIGRLINELVFNVAEHCSSRDLRSLVQVSVTRGGGERGRNRLHLTVLDTGPGIPATARPKLSREAAASLEERQLITRLLEGSLSPWGRGRGQGLPRVVDVCRQWKANLNVTSKQTSVVLRHTRGGDQGLRGRTLGFRLDGTVIVVSLPLPQLGPLGDTRSSE